MDQTLAIAKGYIEEAYDGIDVEIINFDNGIDAVHAMISGDVDFFYSGCNPIVSGIAAGLEGKVIWIHDLIGVAESVAVREGSGIETLKDLEGKKIAVPFTSTVHYTLERGLESQDVDISKVEMLDMDPPEIFAAWSRGDVDAAAVWDPVLSTLENSKIIYTAEDAAADGYPTFDLTVVSDDFSEAYPEMVVKYVEAMEKAKQLKLNEFDEAVAVLADAMELTEEEAAQQATGSIWLTAEEQLEEAYFGGKMAENLHAIGEYLYEGGNLIEEPGIEIFENAIDASYIEEALGK